MVFNSKCKRHKTKIPLKKSSYTSIYLSTYLSINAPESLGKNIDIQKDCFYQYTHTMKLIFPSKLLLVKLFCCFFSFCPSSSDHKCIACTPCWSNSTFGMRPPALKCKWRTILHWFVSVKLYLGDNCSLGLFITVTLTGSASHYGHSMSLEIKQN